MWAQFVCFAFYFRFFVHFFFSLVMLAGVLRVMFRSFIAVKSTFLPVKPSVNWTMVLDLCSNSEPFGMGFEFNWNNVHVLCCRAVRGHRAKCLHNALWTRTKFNIIDEHRSVNSMSSVRWVRAIIRCQLTEMKNQTPKIQVSQSILCYLWVCIFLLICHLFVWSMLSWSKECQSKLNAKQNSIGFQ